MIIIISYHLISISGFVFGIRPQVGTTSLHRCGGTNNVLERSKQKPSKSFPLSAFFVFFFFVVVVVVVVVVGTCSILHSQFLDCQAVPGSHSGTARKPGYWEKY